MSKDFKVILGTIVEVAGVLVLAGSAIKSECERHKAVVELLNTKMKLGISELDGVLKDIKIKKLEEELKKYKPEKEEEA